MIEFQIGKQQHYALGQYLRVRYAKLLGNGDYSVEKVFVHSTVRCKNQIKCFEISYKFPLFECFQDTDRTLMSAQACLASLFAPQGNQIWNAKLNWQPVPVSITKVFPFDLRYSNEHLINK